MVAIVDKDVPWRSKHSAQREALADWAMRHQMSTTRNHDNDGCEQSVKTIVAADIGILQRAISA